MAKHQRCIENDFIAARENCTCVQVTFLRVIKQQCSWNAEQLIKKNTERFKLYSNCNRPLNVGSLIYNCRNKIEYHIDFYRPPATCFAQNGLAPNSDTRQICNFSNCFKSTIFVIFNFSNHRVTDLSLKTSASGSFRVLRTFSWTTILFKTQKSILQHNCTDTQLYL